MNVPTHLSHKPIIAVNDYHLHDVDPENHVGPIDESDSDAKALSIGIAQWENNNNDISAKVFRQTESGRWSRQSEELPLSRLIDLCTLTIASFISTTSTDSDLPLTNLQEHLVLENTENLPLIREYYLKHRTFLSGKIKELEKIIEIFNERVNSI